MWFLFVLNLRFSLDLLEESSLLLALKLLLLITTGKNMDCMPKYCLRGWGGGRIIRWLMSL